MTQKTRKYMSVRPYRIGNVVVIQNETYVVESCNKLPNDLKFQLVLTLVETKRKAA